MDLHNIASQLNTTDFTTQITLLSTSSSTGIANVVRSVPNLILIGCLSVLVFLFNVVVLVASKYTSSGKTSTLIFVRSLCVAEILMAIYGGLKTLLSLLQPPWINCFIGESLMFTSILASLFTLFGFTVDVYREIIGIPFYMKIDVLWIG